MTMKYWKLIPLIALLWIAIPLHAQLTTSTRASINLSSDVEFSLIRNYNSKMFYYVRTQDSSFFALSAVEGVFAQRVFIHHRYKVSDIEVLGDYAYFCGRNITTNRGFVGVFHIQNFITGSTTYRISENFVTPADPNGYVYDITDVRRLCVYSGGQTPGPHVVAVCASTHNDCVLEIMNASPTNSSWLFNIGEASEATETLYDVVATQNYVVTAGTNNDDEKLFSLRIYNKSSIFSSSFYHTIYPFQGESNTHITPGLEDYHITALDRDSMAVLSTIKTASSLPAIRDGVMLTIFDVSSMVNQEAAFSTFTAGLLCNDITGKADVSALRYDNQYQRIIGVVHYDTTPLQPSPPTPITKAWIPEFFLPHPTYVFSDKGEWTWFQSADTDAANGRYFAIGRHQNTQNNLVLFMKLYSHGSCNATTRHNLNNSYLFYAKGRNNQPLTILNNYGVISATYSPLRVDFMILQQDCTRTL